MVPRRHRLSRQRPIRVVLRAGRRQPGRFLTIRWQASSQTDARTTFVVSRRVSKLATVRNKIKRRLRDSIRTHLPLLTGHDIVVVANPAATTATFQELRTELHSLLTPITNVTNRRRSH